MERLICVIIGYALGLIETGYFYGKLHHVDIRQKGSGNVGTTNALRTLGWKAGLVTFLGDCFKCIIAVVIVHLIYGRNHADMVPMLAMYAGLGAVLGHNYPFYMKFKGGKGMICIAVFAGTVALTRYVSVGSLVVVTVYMIEVIVYGQMGGYGVEAGYLHEMYGIAVFLVLSAFFKHRANIGRLLNGTENKLSVGKES